MPYGASVTEYGRRGHPREGHPSQQLDRRAPLPAAEAELGRLGEAAQVRHAQHRRGACQSRPVAAAGSVVAAAASRRSSRAGESAGRRRPVAGLAHIGEHGRVVGREDLERAGGELRVLVAHRQHAPQPVEERGGVPLLRLDVDGLVAVDRVHQRGQVELGEVGAGETAVAVGRPLHRRAHAVAVAEVDVVAHEQLVAVVEDRAPGQRQEQAVEQLGDAAVVVDERGQPPPDPEVACASAGSRAYSAYM